MIGLTTVVMTFLGGSLSGINWRLAFLLVPIASLLCLAAVPMVLPQEPRLDRGKQDLLGQALLALGVISFLYGISHLGSSLTDAMTVGPLVGGTLLLGGYFVHESRSDSRFFPVSLFRSPVFLAAICAGFFYNFTNAVSFLQLTNLWQYVEGLKTLEVSLWQLRLLIAGILVALAVAHGSRSPLATVVVDRLTNGGVAGRLNEAGVPPTRTAAALDAVSAYAADDTRPTNALPVRRSLTPEPRTGRRSP